MKRGSTPRSAMVVVAHPDDAEFTVAGTVAAWAAEGCCVTYVICTDGNAGTHDPGVTAEELAAIRRAEQQAACETLGVNEVIFLGYDDGQLQPSLELRRDLVRAIRKHKPEAVVTWDPMRLFGSNSYINHPDHRAASQATIDAVAPACEMPLLWPELGPPHSVRQVYVWERDRPNLWVDVTDTIDLKIAALRHHASQLGDWDPTERIRSRGAEAGKQGGLAYAESYRVITLWHDGAAEQDEGEQL